MVIFLSILPIVLEYGRNEVVAHSFLFAGLARFRIVRRLMRKVIATQFLTASFRSSTTGCSFCI